MNDSTPSAQLAVTDVDAWRAWLDKNEHTSNGVGLILAKKRVTAPTSLTYAEALNEALCNTLPHTSGLNQSDHEVDVAL